MAKVQTEQRRQARELRDACMLLAARHGFAAQRDGAHLTEVVLDPFRIWLTPSGGRREVEVWRAGAATAKVLDLRWSGDGDLTVVSFNRGAWEASCSRLLTAVPPHPDSSLPCPRRCSPARYVRSGEGARVPRRDHGALRCRDERAPSRAQRLRCRPLGFPA